MELKTKFSQESNEWHNLAFLLDPRFKNSNLLNENDIRNAKTSLTILVDENHESIQMNESESQTQEPIPKAKKDEFSEFYGSSSQTFQTNRVLFRGKIQNSCFEKWLFQSNRYVLEIKS